MKALVLALPSRSLLLATRSRLVSEASKFVNVPHGDQFYFYLITRLLFALPQPLM